MYFKSHQFRHAVLGDATFLDTKVCVCVCYDDVAASDLWIPWVGIWSFHLLQLECPYCLTSSEECSSEIMENNAWEPLWGTTKPIVMDCFLSDLSASSMINWINAFWNTICMIYAPQNSHLNAVIPPISYCIQYSHCLCVSPEHLILSISD